MAKLGDLADQQTPLLRDLQRAAPDLNTFFTQLGPFTKASRPAFRSLGQTSITGKKALNDSRRDVDQLAALAADAPRVGKPLRQFLQTLDTRSRTTEPDVRAKTSAPPAPDPTAYTSSKQGFTGFEAFWNYVYWQTLAINPMDEVGHVLRGLFILGSPCANYQTGAGYKTDPKVKALFDKCNSWLGPYQPGVNAKDPTGEVDSKGQTVDDKKLTGDGGRGQQEAKPTPGQPDLSKPQITLPPEVQQLLDTLKVPGTAPSLPQLPGGLPQLPQDVIKQLTDSLGATGATGPVGPDGSVPTDPTQLLNYLLGK
jgi:hypothetical protein